MGRHARITPDWTIRIDTTAWLDQRTGGPDPDLTGDLHTWAATHTNTGEANPGQPEPHRLGAEPPVGVRNWPAVARAWCAARGHETPEPDFLAHTGTRLDADLWILRAAVGSSRYRIAVIGINQDPPVVHAEVPLLDPWDWFDADSVDICCPGGHGWTWRTGRELVTANTGTFTTLTVVFGANLDAPYAPCPACTAHQLGQSATSCGCDGTPWIVCPVCGKRCDVELPAH
jgi:hypothetical protein